jgi:hypothetical protein
MPLAEAEQVVAAFAAKHAQSQANEPLQSPKSLDDVGEILKRDQLDLFAKGGEFLKTQQGLPALALRAQLELAWGEASVIVADILREQAARLRPQKKALEAKAESKTASADEVAELARLRVTIDEGAATATALMVVGEAHIKEGSTLAQQVIAQNPNDYVGYRVAADFYRLNQDWEQFAAMVAMIEKVKPDSNGLAFLRAIAAADRDNDRAKAAQLFREALARDPQFIRAQAQLVLWADSVATQYQEYEALKAKNPSHQIVLWAGERIQQDAGATPHDKKSLD